MCKDMLGTPGESSLGLVIDFASKLKAGSISLELAKKFLRGELLDLTIWQTIKLGSAATGLKTADDFRLQATKRNLRIGCDANRLLDSKEFSFMDESMELNLVIVAVGALGFNTGSDLRSIFRRAEKFGLQKCPPELGPQLYLQNQKRLSGSKWFRIGMDPISDPQAGYRIFSLRGDYMDEPLLVAVTTRLESHFLASEKFIFMIS
jgi:hypothetical protein